MSEWQTPAYAMSMSTSRGPRSRRFTVVRTSGSVADGAAYAATVSMDSSGFGSDAGAQAGSARARRAPASRSQRMLSAIAAADDPARSVSEMAAANADVSASGAISPATRPTRAG